tara:strand:+ start:360 stop:530 length:171 start_codon:yes stop_codon:yes gene_type:complete
VEEDCELTDEQLENVIGGAHRDFFLDWAAKQVNIYLYTKEQYDKQTNEEPARPGND